MTNLLQRTWFRYLLVLLWMGVIFRLSATPDLRTVPLAQRLGLLPQSLGYQATDMLEFVLRKSAHMMAFGLLALLVRYALAGSSWRPAPGRLSLYAWLTAVAYAASDEWHQTFVPTRAGKLSDVLIDAGGALLALLLVRRRQTQTR